MHAASSTEQRAKRILVTMTEQGPGLVPARASRLSIPSNWAIGAAGPGRQEVQSWSVQWMAFGTTLVSPSPLGNQHRVHPPAVHEAARSAMSLRRDIRGLRQTAAIGGDALGPR